MKAETNSVVAIYETHERADHAVRELQAAGLDMTTVSIVGKDSHTEGHAVGYYTAGDRMRYWGQQGAVWGGFWGVLLGSAFFWVPGVGSLLVAGPLVALMIAGLEGAAVVGGLSALGAGLAGVGIPNDDVVKYEAEVKAGKLLLVVHGTDDEVDRARTLLHPTPAESGVRTPAGSRWACDGPERTSDKPRG